ncbi:MAG TPA: radical SAM family heme chaperone HemW [Anaerolineae bacterium]|nr:radical SAM family heme chaperone HemW [Anaerolineae bacterium]HQH39579.1 radical SAM family heme chaperone HemW [Anaerolineae bacterium]
MKTAIYIHVPFCLQRCTYCDFNTYSGLLSLRPAYVDVLCREIHHRATLDPEVEATTLYFGGGTPSLLPAEGVGAVIAAVRRYFTLPPDAEITLEANPGTVDAPLLSAFHTAGINRLSLGVQSAHDDELQRLGRIHTWDEAVRAVAAARQAGFDNIGIDLIYGLPGQTLARWEETLRRTLTLDPQHLSLYALTLEPETPLAQAIDAGQWPSPDPDLAADMYERASEMLGAAGFWQYEISNWARGLCPPETVWALPPDGQTEAIGPWVSHHNLVYWRNQPWWGLGAGAYSWWRQRRWSNIPHPVPYVEEGRAGRWPEVEVEIIPPSLERGETLMLGLRLAEGVSEACFRARFGAGLIEGYGDTVARLSAAGLVLWDGVRLRLSARGRLLGNQVFGAFLA